jgi:hypothetical protein
MMMIGGLLMCCCYCYWCGDHPALIDLPRGGLTDLFYWKVVAMTTAYVSVL